ncbi:MAG: hypothetical protein KF773_23600 [Deltaproteobacteria bacterium]|nr:hypothetical protein [Deltaproteobacteria bacterium]
MLVGATVEPRDLGEVDHAIEDAIALGHRRGRYNFLWTVAGVVVTSSACVHSACCSSR